MCAGIKKVHLCSSSAEIPKLAATGLLREVSTSVSSCATGEVQNKYTLLNATFVKLMSTERDLSKVDVNANRDQREITHEQRLQIYRSYPVNSFYPALILNEVFI